ncbi:MAG: transposase [Segetibacter sp.]|nr:transposase [Segetibacter sp.]
MGKDKKIICVNIEKGRKHDFKVFKESDVHIHEKVCVQLDSGYEGIKGYHTNSSHPHKNTKNHPLTKRQKKKNHEISSSRVQIEHTIRELKVFRILSERYRNR